MDSVLFYVFGAFAVATSLLVIGQRSPMHSVLLLIASFGALAGLYVLLDAPFVAVTQIIIYAGAIMVLFLFVVMLLNVPREDVPGAASAFVPTPRVARSFGAVLAIFLTVELIWAISRARDSFAGEADSPAGGVREIGRVLFTDYAFAFEVTSILILIAMLGAVVIARPGGTDQ